MWRQSEAKVTRLFGGRKESIRVLWERARTIGSYLYMGDSCSMSFVYPLPESYKDT